ncbi:MAG TPA: hypothetical protein VF609_06350 [Flavisolibacter sp.]
MGFLLLLTLSHLNMKAQTTTGAPAGEYYLRGVTETASGFKLNNDSTFEFFFSYGALDRFGEGHWSLKNDSVVFTSRPRPEHDFRLVTSGKTGSKKILIQLKEMNPALQQYVSCKISGGGRVQKRIANQNGHIEFPMQPIDSIELLFEFCPEKNSVFRISKKGQNKFVFAPEPWLIEVFFHNFQLAVTREGLAGGHPLSNETNLRYEKSLH